MHEVLHILEHTVLETLRLLPFLFITYLAMEYIEHKISEKSKEIIQKAGKLGPVLGAIVGIFPQCGFSVSATNLYAARVITLGTLISVYLATSDINVPNVITLAEYKLVADTENPHCGNIPTIAPNTGPNFPAF